jgi:hypothetical protein
LAFKGSLPRLSDGVSRSTKDHLPPDLAVRGTHPTVMGRLPPRRLYPGAAMPYI